MTGGGNAAPRKLRPGHQAPGLISAAHLFQPVSSVRANQLPRGRTCARSPPQCPGLSAPALPSLPRSPSCSFPPRGLGTGCRRCLEHLFPRSPRAWPLLTSPRHVTHVCPQLRSSPCGTVPTGLGAARRHQHLSHRRFPEPRTAPRTGRSVDICSLNNWKIPLISQQLFLLLPRREEEKIKTARKE